MNNFRMDITFSTDGFGIAQLPCHSVDRRRHILLRLGQRFALIFIFSERTCRQQGPGPGAVGVDVAGILNPRKAGA